MTISTLDSSKVKGRNQPKKVNMDTTKSRSANRKDKHADPNVQVLIPTSLYPCRWDDLIDQDSKEVVISICCLIAAGEDEKAKEGIFKAEDGIWDIFVDEEQITAKKLKELLDAWSSVAGRKYKIVWDEDYLDYTKA